MVLDLISCLVNELERFRGSLHSALFIRAESLFLHIAPFLVSELV